MVALTVKRVNVPMLEPQIQGRSRRTVRCLNYKRTLLRELQIVSVKILELSVPVINPDKIDHPPTILTSLEDSDFD
jgi:hypothetical protein